MMNKTVLGPVTQAGAEKRILSVEKPQTQCIEAVKSLLAWRGRASDPLPSFLEMGEGEARMVLVLSNKKDCFYVVTDRECSCPAHNWHPNQRCKHQRKHFAEQAIHKQSMAETLEQADKNLPRMPYQYQRMVRAAREEAEADGLLELADRKPFRPFIEDDGKPTRAAGGA
ncbi:MAG: hypothetical protein KBA97_12250 [Methanothrix sp.]|nr:hypothetical protein [Methanothrix sp.]